MTKIRKEDFDTHNAVKRLISSGFKEKAAESIVDLLKTAQESEGNRYSSRQKTALLEKDFSNLKNAVATKSDIKELRAETKADINDLKAELLKWFIGIAGVQSGIFALIKRFF